MVRIFVFFIQKCILLEIEHGGQCYGAGAALFWLEPVGLLMRNLLYEKENIILHLSTTSGSVSFMKILLYLSRWTAFQRRRDHFRDKDKEKCTRSTVGTSSPIVFFSGCSDWSKLTGSLGWILRRRTHHWNWNVPVTHWAVFAELKYFISAQAPIYPHI